MTAESPYSYAGSGSGLDSIPRRREFPAYDILDEKVSRAQVDEAMAELCNPEFPELQAKMICENRRSLLEPFSMVQRAYATAGYKHKRWHGGTPISVKSDLLVVGVPAIGKSTVIGGNNLITPRASEVGYSTAAGLFGNIDHKTRKLNVPSILDVQAISMHELQGTITGTDPFHQMLKNLLLSLVEGKGIPIKTSARLSAENLRIAQEIQQNYPGEFVLEIHEGEVTGYEIKKDVPVVAAVPKNTDISALLPGGHLSRFGGIPLNVSEEDCRGMIRNMWEAVSSENENTEAQAESIIKYNRRINYVRYGLNSGLLHDQNHAFPPKIRVIKIPKSMTQYLSQETEQFYGDQRRELRDDTPVPTRLIIQVINYMYGDLSLRRFTPGVEIEPGVLQADNDALEAGCSMLDTYGSMSTFFSKLAPRSKWAYPLPRATPLYDFLRTHPQGEDVSVLTARWPEFSQMVSPMIAKGQIRFEGTRAYFVRHRQR